MAKKKIKNEVVEHDVVVDKVVDGLEHRLDKLEKRIDRIVAAHESCRSLKGL